MESQQFVWVLSLYWLERYNRVEDAAGVLAACDWAAAVWLAQTALLRLPELEFLDFGARLRRFFQVNFIPSSSLGPVV